MDFISDNYESVRNPIKIVQICSDVDTQGSAAIYALDSLGGLYIGNWKRGKIEWQILPDPVTLLKNGNKMETCQIYIEDTKDHDQ